MLTHLVLRCIVIMPQAWPVPQALSALPPRAHCHEEKCIVPEYLAGQCDRLKVQQLPLALLTSLWRVWPGPRVLEQ